MLGQLNMCRESGDSSMKFLFKPRKRSHKMAAATGIIMTALLCGCSYHGQLKQAALFDNQVISNKIATKVTLLNKMDGIKNLDFTVGAATLNYDIKEPYFNALKDTLNTIYNQVEIGSEASSNSQLIAVPYFNATINNLPDGAGIDTLSRVDILDGSSKKLIKSYQVKYHINYVTPPSAHALGFLTGLTLFALAPVTIPIALNQMGNHGQDLLEGAIRESLASIKTELTQDEKINGEMAKIEACFKKLAKQPSLTILTGKVAVDDVKKQTFDMLTNRAVPTEQEKTTIKQWSNMRAGCYAAADAFYARTSVPASLLALYGSTKTAGDNLLVLLYNGAITYGEFAQKRQDIQDASVTAEAQIKEELAKQSAEAHARADQLAMQAQQTNLAEIQTRQMQTQTQLMGLQTINQSIQTQNQQRFINQQNQNQQTLINQLNRPTTTNCSRYGNSINCTSR